MNFDLARHNMVVNQLERRGISDPRVLEAMDWVRREEFVPLQLRDKAYDDCALPIGLEQTISQPYTVAFMCHEARISAGDKVLEIGTGSGYGAAVLSLLAGEVHTVERIETLARIARERLERLGNKNVHVHHVDGSLGLAEDAPFDAIIVTAGAEVLPNAYLAQLAEGGRLVIPIGPPTGQQMFRFTQRGDRHERETLGRFGFVPLVADDAASS
jgi:protein-L-isoaspartate(D-aspartate) O-methyltransferase